jgi:hypothetical protein
MRSLTSLHESRVYSPENFWSPVQKDFCNNIPLKADMRELTSPRPLSANSDLTRRSKIVAYSITSSASASNLGGISRPSAVAVLRLITNSTFVDW